LRNRLRNKTIWLGVLCLLMAMNGYAAVAANEPAPLASETAGQQKTAAETEAKTGTVGIADVEAEILGGTGLKTRKLSEVFEQFVPSESISADNAVPFPVDI